MKTFLLGVGCQKGGTSWLHQYLSAHPACDFGFRKEYHVFDELWRRDLPESGNFERHALEELATLAGAAAGRLPAERAAGDRRLEEALRLVSFHLDPAQYAAYFDALFSGSETVRVVGDITPSYSGLSAENFTTIRRLLGDRGFRVKAVFLMRDPVERIYSQMRMNARSGPFSGSDPVALFNQRFQSPGVEMRTRYESTLTALARAFDPADVFYGFYETLFTDSELHRLTGFLGIAPAPADFALRVNASPREAELDAASIARARAHYDATYRACFDRFGADFVKRIWPHA